MKLTGIELIPGGSAGTVNLSFRDPRRSLPYNVRKVEGLDASEIISRFASVPGNSDEKYYNLSMEKRELGFVIELNPNFVDDSYSDLRDDMYKMISATRTGLIQVMFKDGLTDVATISGHISKLETDLFDKNQEVTLRINCDTGETLLKAPTAVAVDVSGVSPASTTIVDDISTAPHGFQFQIRFLEPAASFRIEDAGHPSIFFEVTPVGGFVADDILTFSSEPATKTAYFTRAGVVTYLADVITRSAWPILFPGTNAFEVITPSMEWVSITHLPTFWGV